VNTTPRPLYPWVGFGILHTAGWIGHWFSLDGIENSRPYLDLIFRPFTLWQQLESFKLRGPSKNILYQAKMKIWEENKIFSLHQDF